MSQLLYLTGSVYVLENSAAKRAKVGMTGIGVNDVADRLQDINDMWTERKITCQICGGRLMKVGALVPRHVKNGTVCVGGNAPPLESGVVLAEQQLEKTLARIGALAGAEKGSAVRVAKTLTRRIDKYRNYVQPAGEWQFSVAYFTTAVAEVESLAHKKLAALADHQAPFGEVFCCLASEAAEAVEAALNDLGLLGSAVRRTCLPKPRAVAQQPRLWDDAYAHGELAERGEWKQ